MSGSLVDDQREVLSLWVTRKSIDSGFHPPELLVAWDEWSVDENHEGWQEACDEALAAVEADLSQWRVIRLRINGALLAAHFDAPSVPAIVLKSEESA